ncbi:hypothetical protein [Streptomyces zagrosensis]|uniref:Uncharacterized protein n=1 Tax=Streptomyces zagrosensis TaxID=1042984 RepID=A0A7W9Q6B7_9ACTN|nr:hypothetical protein [Streptomyces zagrosensis]MBB5933928.1 hypothetical protein [Streptomyces zagrosensis]
MPLLERAPESCGAWIWELEEYAPAGLGNALLVAAEVASVLERRRLHKASALRFDWYAKEGGGTGFASQLSLRTPLSDRRLTQRIRDAQPVGVPEAEVGDITVLGSGEWLDEQGVPHSEVNLISLITSPDPTGLAIELAVCHDVWMQNDFRGRPHPELYQRNAPRLAAALEELDTVLGVTAFPGEPTYFGIAEGHGIAMPDLDKDGFGPDLTDKL